MPESADCPQGQGHDRNGAIVRMLPKQWRRVGNPDGQREGACCQPMLLSDDDGNKDGEVAPVIRETDDADSSTPEPESS